MKLEEIVTLCKRRGFVYQSSVIYGGLKGFFDYGPLGVELKNNIKKSWWKEIVYKNDNIYGLDASNILNKNVLYQSGHADGFVDIFIDCKNCKSRFRDDEISNKCLKCGSEDLCEPRKFNLMMNVNVGPIEGEYACLRPETAQSIFINYKNICDSFSTKLPFGISQIGKAYRNEVTPKSFIIRTREFEQMEMEYFVKKENAETEFNNWIEKRIKWWKKQGIIVQKYNQTSEELAHYSKATTDLMYEIDGKLEELEGIANRADFDLGSHTKQQSGFKIESKVKENIYSTEKLCYFENGESFIPHIIETSCGVERAFLAILYNAYHKEETRTVLKLPYHLSPVKVAVMPLAKNNEKIIALTKNVADLLKNHDIFPVSLEIGSNIGKMYKKHDEIGTPFCITIDFDSIEGENKDTVTIRNRDTMEQKRILISDLYQYLMSAF